MCLFCSADDGVSIPGEYTSFLAPISSSKLYNEVRACREKDRDPEVNSHSLLAVSSLFNAFLFFCQHNFHSTGRDEEVKELRMWESD